MKKLISSIIVAAFIFLVAAPVTATILPANASAAGKECPQTVMGIPTWYRGLVDEKCDIVPPNSSLLGNDPATRLPNFIWRVVLNAIEMALAIIAYLAVFFIIYGGFLFLTGGAVPAQVERGRKTILNAIIGLAISLGAIGITRFIFSVIGDTTTTANGIPTLSAQQLLVNGFNIAYFIGGAIAVVVIVIAGLFYVTSAGDAGRVTKAKNLLTYSIVGLVVILTAFAITNFVIGRF